MVINVGIGEFAASDNVNDKIMTYALASCVAVTAYSPLRKAAGMIHIVLPSPSACSDGNSSPYYYAVTGVPLLINKMCITYGCLKSELVIRLFGGANSINKDDVFILGKRNINSIEGVLKELRLSFDSAETGGFLSRTLEMNVATGKVAIRTQSITI